MPIFFLETMESSTDNTRGLMVSNTFVSGFLVPGGEFPRGSFVRKLWRVLAVPELKPCPEVSLGGAGKCLNSHLSALASPHSEVCVAIT